MDKQVYTLLSASNELGLKFIKAMKAKGEPVAALVNNIQQEQDLSELGITVVVRVDNKEDSGILFPPVS